MTIAAVGIVFALFKVFLALLSMPHSLQEHETVLRPIPQHPDTAAWATDRVLFDEWYHDIFRETFEATVSREVPWQPEARELLEAVIAYWSGDLNTPPLSEIRSLSASLLRKRVDDPLILFFCGFSLAEAVDRIPLLEWALSELESSDYPRVAALWAAVELAAAQSEIHQTMTRDTEQLALRLLKEAVENQEFPAGDGGVVLQSHLLSTWPEGFVERNGAEIADFLETHDDVAEWVRHLIRGEHYVKVAWRHRGSGWARNVSKKQWKGFFHFLVLAEKELTRAWELNPQHPRAATRMIHVSMGHSQDPLEDMRMWFDRAATARFDWKVGGGIPRNP